MCLNIKALKLERIAWIGLVKIWKKKSGCGDEIRMGEIKSLEKMREERKVRIEKMIENLSVLIYLMSMKKKSCFRFLRRFPFVWLLGNFNKKINFAFISFWKERFLSFILPKIKKIEWCFYLRFLGLGLLINVGIFIIVLRWCLPRM